MEHYEENVTGGNKAELAYQTLRYDILVGKYPAGSLLNVRQLSLELNVSRTPVKEAITRLAHEGYVEFFPNRIAMVSRISSTDVIELLELRGALEDAAAYFAALRRTEADISKLQQIHERHRSVPIDDIFPLAEWDRQFHMAVAKSAYNHHLYQTTEQVFMKLARIVLPISKDRRNASIAQHEAILNAIRDGNAEAARQRMSEHDLDILTSVKTFQYQNIHLFK